MPFAQPPLPNIPRRKSSDAKRPIFSFGGDDNDDSRPSRRRESSSSSSEDGDAAADRSSPTPPPTLRIHLVPFPTLSPLTPVRRTPDASPSPTGDATLPRTSSTPIILSNGKPLKPSLKSSHSSPHIPQSAAHLRSQSAPSTPILQPKNVHFPEQEKELQSVRLYRPAGRPLAISTTGADETETETEGYDSATVRGGYPFPGGTPDTLIQLHSELTSTVPAPTASPYGNVHLETLQLPRTRPSTICGSVLVRNLTYSKSVTVRFTLDDWQTTSEVSCKYVTSLVSLPPPFRQDAPSRVGDALTAISHASVSAWDRWSFQIRLEDVERRLTERTMFLACRFVAHGDGGGEWWDNNNGANYRLSFRKEAATPPAQSPATTMHARSASSATIRANARPQVNTTPSFPTRPSVLNYNPISPVSPKLSLRNYVSPSATPPAPAPVPLPVEKPPSPGLPSPPASRDASPPKELPAALPHVSSPGEYAQLVKQWCFAGDGFSTPTANSSGTVTPMIAPTLPTKKFAPEWERFRHGGGAFGGRLAALPGVSVGAEMG